MIDIFAPDFQARRVMELAKKALEDAEKATPEENLKYLQSRGIVDENGQFTPKWEAFKYL